MEKWCFIFSPPSAFPAQNIKEATMIRCNMCGAPIKPWFEACNECYYPAAIMPEMIKQKI